MPTAFAPGRVNLIGEHTDYNDGLALAFAIERGVTVTAEAGNEHGVEASALDLGEHDRFDSEAAAPAPGWRGFVRGMVAELRAESCDITAARVQISGNLPRDRGLASSAALEVALALALLELHGCPRPADVELARLCSRVEQRWSGAQTGLLDQLASLCGEPEHAVRIDFRALRPALLRADFRGWRCVLVDSGEERTLATSGYNQRRAECEEAKRHLGLRSLRDATSSEAAALPHPLDRRVLHVIEENQRVDAAVDALRSGDMDALGSLLNDSHRSLRDLYEVSTPAVEETVERVLRHAARGARIMGGGFGGQVLALFPPDVQPPQDGLVVTPSDGARIVAR